MTTATPQPKPPSPPTSPSVLSPRVPCFDALRGIGVLQVIFYHMGYKFLANAWFVISLFFSLSGFLITKVTVESYERHGRIDIPKFWARRVSRLFPALLTTIVAIALSQKLPFRIDDGIQFQRERVDLLYATLFATNINLAYNQLDDYFDEFSVPSITRHLWTLSIEEQYYIVWPLVVWFLAEYFGKGAKGETLPVKCYDGDHRGMNGSTKRLLTVILAMDSLVMVLSYFSSLITIQEMGMSAAYYSTYCRMGDIAAGGFTYSFVRLTPSISKRWYNNPILKPMTTLDRIILEFFAAVLLAIVVLVPMIQVPVEKMLPIYFKYVRLSFSAVSFFCVLHAIQSTEPLPRWSISSRILSCKPLSTLGMFSYGVYLFHWPLIVLFGNRRGGIRENADTTTLTRDAIIFALTIGIGYVSFMFLEVPALEQSIKTKPPKTLFVGFSAMLITVAIIQLTTFGLPPMVSFEDGTANRLVPSIPVDHRRTPIAFAMDQDASGALTRELLDFNTRPFKVLHPTLKSMINRYSELTDGASSIILVSCKNRAETSPCDHDVWNVDSYFIWLASTDYCGGDVSNKTTEFFQRRCNDVLTIEELDFPNLSPEFIPTHIRSLTSLVLAINDIIPGIINQNTISRIQQKRDNEFSTTDFSNSCKPLRITVAGESIARKIGQYWKDYADYDMAGATNLTKETPCPVISNFAYGWHSPIAYYACLSGNARYDYFCHNFTSTTPLTILESFRETKPDAVVVHDQHWALWKTTEKDRIALPSTFDKVVAFNFMALDALRNGAADLYFLTQSPDFWSEKFHKQYALESSLVMQVVDVLSCEGDQANNKSLGHMRLVVVDWAKLVCPKIDENGTQCKKQEHGYRDILPDGRHPHGPSGNFLTMETLAVIMADIKKNSSNSTLSWDEALNNPISKHVLLMVQRDLPLPIQKLVSVFTICPRLRVDEVEMSFESVNFTHRTSY